MTRLEGRRVVVVGVGSAIGAACAGRAAHEGAQVLAVDPDPEVVATVVSNLGENTAGCVAGLASADAAAAVASRCEEIWHGVDVLLDCGAAMEVWPEEDDTLDKVLEVIAVNALGPLAYTQALRPLLARSSHASIVYLGSIDGLLGNPVVYAYSMGKGALTILTHVMAARLGADGIRVNCVAASGLVQTGSGVPPLERDLGGTDLLRRLTPLGRTPAPEELAAVMAFFASDDASYVSGTVLPVDGGRLAATPGTW